MTVQLDPIWLNAAERAHAQFQYGDLIPWEWIRTELEIEPMAEGSYEEFQELQFRTLTLVDQFRAHLLIEHKKALRNIRGAGYLIINPSQQTDAAMNLLAEALVRNIRNATKVLESINFGMLNDRQIQANVEARSRVAAIHAFASSKMKVTSNGAPKCLKTEK